MSPRMLAVFCLSSGLFSIAGAWYDWDFFMQHRWTRSVARLLGRGGVRIVYALVGGLLVLLSPLLLLGILHA